MRAKGACVCARLCGCGCGRACQTRAFHVGPGRCSGPPLSLQSAHSPVGFIHTQIHSHLPACTATITTTTTTAAPSLLLHQQLNTSNGNGNGNNSNNNNHRPHLLASIHVSPIPLVPPALPLLCSALPPPIDAIATLTANHHHHPQAEPRRPHLHSPPPLPSTLALPSSPARTPPPPTPRETCLSTPSNP